MEEVNIIDLALSDCDGEFIGASGSNRNHIWISEYSSSLGYAETVIKPGRWNVIVGAYKIMDGGVTVEYEFTFTHKERILLKGDLHTHTLGSDGILSVDELTEAARKSGLQFLFITDHNNYFHNNIIKSREDITVMPGVEWTHFKGHVNMLGIKKAYDGPYYTNTLEETREKIDAARKKGAIISINHPFCPSCGFKWGLENFEYDCIEIWNGPMKKAELDCIAWWHGELCKGRRIPAVGGSDFHRYEPGRGIGMPATCIYAMSRAPSDIYAAIRQGCGYITYEPNGPGVYAECDGKLLGETVDYGPDKNIIFQFTRLRGGDVVKIFTDKSNEEIQCTSNTEKFIWEKKIEKVLFYRAEVYRPYVDGLPAVPVLISNPVYIRSRAGGEAHGR